MSQGKNNFRHDSLQDSQSISNVLDAITKGLSKGKLVFSDDDNKVVMKPNGLLELKVTASQEDDRQRVSIRITWEEENKPKGGKKKLNISS